MFLMNSWLFPYAPFPQIFLILVYIHPKANTNSATEHIIHIMNRLGLISPYAPKFSLGDFNHCSIDKTLKGFHQFVTPFNEILDKCYRSVQGAYKSIPHPPLSSTPQFYLPCTSVKKVERSVTPNSGLIAGSNQKPQTENASPSYTNASEP